MSNLLMSPHGPSVCRLVGSSLVGLYHNFSKRAGKFHFHALIGALVIPLLILFWKREGGEVGKGRSMKRKWLGGVQTCLPRRLENRDC